MDQQGIRLQKVMAQAGVGSRRVCEDLIEAGRVQVNDKKVSVQGMRVDPATDVIKVDGMRIVTNDTQVYFALNKPEGMLSTMSDELGRPCVGDIVEGRNERLFHVGRLDAASEGLLLLTNDGELAHRLMHPSYEVEKTYLAEVAGPVARDVGRRLKAGVELEDGLARVDDFRLVGSDSRRVMIEVTLHEGRKHIVRRMLEHVGHPVERLVRTRIGPVHLGTMRTGNLRRLTPEEIANLYEAVGL
ncbi:pseudouridine synthase [Acidothermaceae bacterium B102]|nr:pseudouridine synthase [Acidothermaceae bacterium B102]